MFCPKCGMNCGEANFCPKCGTQLQQAAQESKQTVWKLGMPCPHCGGTQLEGKHCAFCGAQLMLDEPEVNAKEKKRFNVPLGIYQGPYGYLRLRENDLVIKNKDMRECTIPYELIEYVKYTERSFWCWGRLTIRWKGNSYLPLPDTYAKELKDETTICHKYEDTDVFISIYHALKDLIEE